MFGTDIIWWVLEDKKEIVIAANTSKMIVPAQRLNHNFYFKEAAQEWAKSCLAMCFSTVVHCMSEFFFHLPTWAQICLLLPECAAQMVETNWGGGQNLSVFWKSHSSLEVEGAVAAAQASFGLVEVVAAFPKPNGCSSHLLHFSLNKCLHPSDSANKRVCACEREYLQQPGNPQQQYLEFTLYLLCQGCFTLAAFSWACILPALLQTDLWQTASSGLFQVSKLWRAEWASQRRKLFSPTSPRAWRCSNVLICPTTAPAKLSLY